MSPRYLVLAIGTVFLAACGGGGGSHSNDATPAPTVPTSPGEPTTPTGPVIPTTPPGQPAQSAYQLSPNPIVMKFVAGYPTKVDLAVTQKLPSLAAAHIRITPDSSVIESVDIRSQNAGTFDLTLIPSAATKAGHYTGEITVDICQDKACTASVDGSPFKVPYVIDVLPEEGGTTASNLTPLAPLAGAGDWVTFQGNAAHTGFIPVTLAPARFSVRWTYENAAVNGSQLIMSDIVSSGGRLYFSTGLMWDGGQQGHNLYAFNEHDGKLAWLHDFGDLRAPVANPPGVANGTVYAVGGAQASTAMYAFDAASGKELFSTPVSAQPLQTLVPIVGGGAAPVAMGGMAPVVADGSVYAAAADAEGMVAFDADRGAQQWFARLDPVNEWTPALDAGHAYVYVNDALAVHDRRTGAAVGKIRGPGTAGIRRATPLIGSPDNVIVTADEALMNFDTAKGTLRWSVPGRFQAAPAYDNRTIVVLNAAPFALEARNEADGTQLWSWTPPGTAKEWRGNVLLTKNLVFVSTDSAMFAIDRTTHQTVWSHPFAGRLMLSASGVLYIYNDSTIVAVNVN